MNDDGQVKIPEPEPIRNAAVAYAIGSPIALLTLVFLPSGTSTCYLDGFFAFLVVIS